MTRTLEGLLAAPIFEKISSPTLAGFLNLQVGLCIASYHLREAHPL